MVYHYKISSLYNHFMDELPSCCRRVWFDECARWLVYNLFTSHDIIPQANVPDNEKAMPPRAAYERLPYRDALAVNYRFRFMIIYFIEIIGGSTRYQALTNTASYRTFSIEARTLFIRSRLSHDDYYRRPVWFSQGDADDDIERWYTFTKKSMTDL